MYSLAGTLELMTKLSVVAVLLIGTPGYAFITAIIQKEISDTTGNLCISDKTVSERFVNRPYVQDGGSNRSAHQNNQSQRVINKPAFKNDGFERSLNDNSTQDGNSDRVLNKPEVKFDKYDQFLNRQSILSEQSDRVLYRPVLQDVGSKWNRLRAHKALQAAIQFQKMLQKLTGKKGLI